jgi:hypothetical protein
MCNILKLQQALTFFFSMTFLIEPIDENKNSTEGWGCSSVVLPMLSMCEALGFIPNDKTRKQNKKIALSMFILFS